jgi:hypothetical protein
MTHWFSHLSWAQASGQTEPIDAEVPWIFLFVFGIPLFFTLVYLMIQLTRPDRGGRIDIEVLEREKNSNEPSEADEDAPPPRD